MLRKRYATITGMLSLSQEGEYKVEFFIPVEMIFKKIIMALSRSLFTPPNAVQARYCTAYSQKNKVSSLFRKDIHIAVCGKIFTQKAIFADIKK